MLHIASGAYSSRHCAAFNSICSLPQHAACQMGLRGCAPQCNVACWHTAECRQHAKGAAEQLAATPTACCCSVGAGELSVCLVRLPLCLLGALGQASTQWRHLCMGPPVYARTNSRRLSSACRCTGPSALL